MTIVIMALSWFLVTFLLAVPVLGEFRLANMYADQMVLQMKPKSTQIWGFGTMGVEVTVSVNNQMVNTTVDSSGVWKIRLAPADAGGPYDLTATHHDTVTESVSINVWFGDVWVCSGQSNMEMPISQMLDPDFEIQKALTYENIRLMQVDNDFSDVELSELTNMSTPWSKPSEQNVPSFSALCLMFGERMSDQFGKFRPIGLIDSCRGGTQIEAWSSQRVHAFCQPPPNPGSGFRYDSNLWNAMMHPLTNMAVRGAIWYQGESNTRNNADYYPCFMQRLASDWADTFVDGNVAVPTEGNTKFPFGIVQLGPFSFGGTNSYGFIRWHHTVDQGVLPNAFIPEGFMAASYDTTDPTSPTGDMHPRDKQTVADRLSNAAKYLMYGQNFRPYGPTPVSALSGTGTMTVTYDVDIRVSGTTGFSVRLLNDTWIDTDIIGVSGRQVTVAVDPNATHLAYAWTGVVCDYKACSIYSTDSEQLPAQVWLWSL